MFQNMIRVPKKFEQMLVDMANDYAAQQARFESWCRKELALKDADFKRDPDSDDCCRYKFLYVRQLFTLWKYMEWRMDQPGTTNADKQSV